MIPNIRIVFSSPANIRKKEETPSLFHCIILPSAHKKLRFRTRAVAFVLFKVRINVIVPVPVKVPVPVLMLPAKTVPNSS